jgi:hypothetical protein
MHQTLTRLLTLALCAGGLSLATAAQRPLALHPENPHYFLWRGQPTVLITSGEHYGAVLNADFNYRKYLDTLARDRLNLTRTFTGGAYVEPAGAFNIARNTLAPLEGRYLAPWARSAQPGYARGGNRFDLGRWDEAYFQRLRDFTAFAAKKGVVVEVNLFCPFYEESQWLLSPFHPANNINGTAHVSRTNVYTLDRHEGLLTWQEKLVRRVVAELIAFDNVYYEICNEPYFGGVTLAWQHHIAEVIQQTQRELCPRGPHQLIAQNVANDKALVKAPHPAISLFNFHYASPPDTVGMNHHLNKVIGDNETGFRGTNDAPYRMEAWDFLLAGGGLYNNLDYSFVAGQEDGTFAYPAQQPGGGNPGFRRQLRTLVEFMNGLPFLRMQPQGGVVQALSSSQHRARALVEPDRTWAIYVRPKELPKKIVTLPEPARVQLTLNLPKGSFRVEWVDALTGARQRETLNHSGGGAPLTSPPFREDIGLKITRR